LYTTDDDFDKKTKAKRKLNDSNRAPIVKKWKGIRWKKYDPNSNVKAIVKIPNPKEIDELIQKLNINVNLNGKNVFDKRICVFCQTCGDQETNGPGRLLLMDVHVWCHLNCALWSTEVFERMNGALMNVETAYKRSLNVECSGCVRKGASLKCFSPKCTSHYHLSCALKFKCVFYQDKVRQFTINRNA
jgi:hypothetical protein